MSVNAIVRIREATRVNVDGDGVSGVTIEVQEPGQYGGVSIYGATAEQFEALAAAAKEAARRKRAAEPTARAS